MTLIPSAGLYLKNNVDNGKQISQNIVELIVTTPTVSTVGRRPPQGGLTISGAALVRTYVYVDGFNFYYGAVRSTPYKWLDFKTLFKRLLLPNYEILKIKYFTALISPRPSDPEQPIRQKAFLDALEKFIPEISIIYGQFSAHVVRLPLAQPHEDQLYVDVIRPEEKGSDVNLAVHMVNDAWKDLYDCAVVVSNDSDLSQALRIVRDERKKHVVLFTPPRYKNTRSQRLKASANFCKTIKNADIAASQLPDPIPGTNIHKPEKW